MKKKDRPRSTKRRALRALAVSAALGVAVCGIAVGAEAEPASVHTASTATALAGSRQSPWHHDVAVAAPVVAPPAEPTAEEIKAALTSLAAAAKQSAPVAPLAATPAVVVAEPAPAPAPVATGDAVSDGIAAAFGDMYAKAMRVANCESSLNPNAVSPGGGNFGLFQINAVHRPLVESMGYSWSQIFDPYVNAAVARRIYDDAGSWRPWSCGGA